MKFFNHEDCVSCYIPGVGIGGVVDGLRVTSIRTPIAARIATRDWLIQGNDLLRLQSVVSSCLQLLESSVYLSLSSSRCHLLSLHITCYGSTI
jgi:hypothetical protein